MRRALTVRAGRALAALPAALLTIAVLASCGSTPEQPPPPDLGDPSDFLRPPKSCAYTCPITDCPESVTPYSCPSLGAWKSLPHDDTCPPDWDGTYPTPVAGQCTATTPGGDAILYAGQGQNGTTILPDGRRLHPAGADWVFSETDLTGGLTSALAAIPGTSWVATVDTGYGPHAVRVVDPAKIGQGDPVLGYVKFDIKETLNSAVAFVPPDLLYVATDDGVVQAITLDTQTGAVTRDDARSIALPGSVDGNGNPRTWYVAGLAASADGKRLVVTGVNDHQLLVYDVASGSQTFGQLLGQADLGGAETFGVWFDPSDATSSTAYVSMWDQKRVAEVDVSNPAQPSVKRSFDTEKAPEGVAFLDARWMIVAGDLGDALTLVDRTSGATTRVPVDAAATLYGSEPTTLAYDPTAKRLYTTLSGLNAVRAFDVDLGTTPPTLTPAGMLPAGFWPSGVVAMADGSVVVANMRGRGTGPRPLYFDLGDSDIGDRMRGSIQRVPPPTAQDLTTGEQDVRTFADVGDLAGHPTVQCPGGADDFPVPATNTQGPSKVIQHVFLVVRENKGFDGVFGDMPGVEGDPAYTLKQDPGLMDTLWHNMRALARTFTMSDNYYTDAIYSTQGHVWATYGRSNDFNERTWAISGAGHSARTVPGGGLFDVSRPIEGSLFDWLGANGVPYDLLGEIVGTPTNPPADHPPIDILYPGGPFQNIGYNDDEKACHVAARLRVTCNLGTFVYMTLPNDHTFGLSDNKTTPETYIAVNDDATGMFIDALSHSPIWQSSVAFITEDDPSQGGEHIDSHRTPFVVVSPWVKRGYVSKTHFDMAGLHKTFAHLLGKPYQNAVVANASIPFDMFTSTPDYTPYTYTPRTWPLTCGGAKQGELELSRSWDFSHEDEQPGLDAQVTRALRGQQLDVLGPRTREKMEERLEARDWGE